MNQSPLLLRYENYTDFYANPDVVEDVGIAPLQLCGNQMPYQPAIFTQAVDGLLLDIKDATPKTTNFYVASTRQNTNGNGNGTVYAIAQCIQNITEGICQNCINAAYTSLSNCLPNTEGRSIYMGCFARYSETPFFNDNQTIDITNFNKLNSQLVLVQVVVLLDNNRVCPFKMTIFP